MIELPGWRVHLVGPVEESFRPYMEGFFEANPELRDRVVFKGMIEDKAELYAETVTVGDPTFAGPLGGVSLGLPVYHIFDEAIKSEADPAAWDEQVSMMEMVLDTEALASAVAGMRAANSKHSL